ncbi:hypothetical protein [Holdemania sp. Marseille-P2844]|uniref:hypothetical protein n=1 Tax=Holdemania sp. Marseille-P2844 TaxID=1852366 RepID=UPI000933FCE7|nr:hypothetical protein [Holdemania sp. Marseille-P2844]
METAKFRALLKGNNAIRLDDNWIVFNDLELYNLNTGKSIVSENFDDFLKIMIGKKSIAALISSQDEFYRTFAGGRGAKYGKNDLGGGFNSAGDGRDHGFRNAKFPAEFNVGGKFRSYDKTLDLFVKKYASADHEYGITVDDQGFVHRHIEGGRSSVAISGGKNQMILHNHPSGGNFSKADLISIASGNERGIAAIGTRKIYTISKKKGFDSKAFIKGVSTAKWPKHLSYDDGADWWLRKNAKKYGYSYTARKSK